MKLICLNIQSSYNGFEMTLEVTEEQYELIKLLEEATTNHPFEPLENDCQIMIFWEENI